MDKSHLILQKYRAEEVKKILEDVTTLDLGGGDGWLVTQKVNPKNITCIDLNKSALKRNPCKYKIYGDILKLNPSGKFNQVTLFEVIEHIENKEDRELLISKAYKSLKENGKFIISTPNYERFSTQLRRIIRKKRDYPYPVANFKGVSHTDWHYFEYTLNELKEELEQAGFRKVISYCKFIQIPFIKSILNICSKYGVVLYTIAIK